MMYVFEKKPELALADFTKAIEIKPGNPGPYLVRAVLYKDLLQFDRSLADIKKSLELKPGDVASMILLARVESLRHDATEACRWIKAAFDTGKLKDQRFLADEKDFDKIRTSPCFRELVDR